MEKKDFWGFWTRLKEMIHAIIFSYQNKNLKMVVDSLLENTKNDIFISVFDKNTINRKKAFSEDRYKKDLSYTHISWDEIIGPAEYKGNSLNSTEAEYSLLVSDDTVVSKFWDEKLMSFLLDADTVVSGQGGLSIEKKDLFFFIQNREDSLDFTLTQFIDKNFIFGKTKKMKNLYPIETKYYGEEEAFSLNLFNKNIDIYSAPTGTYTDLQVKNLETEYVPFSLEHNYNSVINSYKQASENFLNFHNIPRDSLFFLPYDSNDVEYNPDLLDFQELDSRKFLFDIKGIS
jgi:hypothetical protein